MDPYRALGVSRTATASEIKTAYRKLASQCHPDKGGDTARFQEIQTAYSILIDAAKRARYEFNNSTSSSTSNNRAHEQNNAFFNNPFGYKNLRPRRNKDLRVIVNITLESTLLDQTKSVSVQPSLGPRFTVEVNLPRGVEHGSAIKFSGKGDNLFESLTRGDLYVIINIVKHDTFTVKDQHLYTVIGLDAVDAMLGTEHTITGIDGRQFAVRIPAGTQHGKSFRLAGQGLYKPNSELKGDLILAVSIVIPELSPNQKQILKSLKHNR